MVDGWGWLVIELPPIDESNARTTLTVGDVTYDLTFRWNARDEGWYLDVYDPDHAQIAAGIRIVLGAYLGRRIKHPLFRDGVLVAIDTTDQGLDATLTDLGTRVLLRYYDNREVGLLRAGAVTFVRSGA